MKRIDKGSEPPEWTQYRCTPGVQYESIAPLRQALYKEQGAICAYCNRRLDDEHNCERVSSNVVEHVISRHADPSKALDYRNMVLCCEGIIHKNGGRITCCDESKGDQPIHFNPTEQHLYDTLVFQSSGKIKSTLADYQQDIDSTLNLNNKVLTDNRKSAIMGVTLHLEKKSQGRAYRKSDLRELLTKYENRDSSGCYKEYAGVIAGYLKQKIDKPIT